MFEKRKAYFPLVLVFALISLLLFLFEGFLKSVNIDNRVVLVANCLLFLISIYNLIQHFKAMGNTNPHAMVRAVMGTTVLKLFVLGGAAFIYLYNAGENKNVNGLFSAMGLYILYTWLDVRIALKTKPSKNNGSN
ncbi:MAG: hypothetical protein K2Q21_03530 [Chitinophagaceae bacterium]|nr:hypothetical protein [Chitinophagaceae bacterium]